MAALLIGEDVTVHNAGISLLLSTSLRRGSFKYLDRKWRDKTNGLTSLSKEGVAKEGRQSLTLDQAGVNPRPSGWQSEKVLSTVPTSHTCHNRISFCTQNLAPRYTLALCNRMIRVSSRNPSGNNPVWS